MDDVAIKINNVSKTFKLPHEKTNSVKGLVVNFWRHNRTFEVQEVLKDVSLDIKKGEFFGIVGRNGSGKSTLLKLLAGIYSPTTGNIQVNGKLTPFIELGVGFSPELSGRENVFLNGALLGFNRKEMEAMYEDIVAFAELGKFMDQKLKNYSSGMQVRLAFSIAIRAKSDILLIDEVLAVGDEAFQQKCVDVFEKYKAQKKTVILVTHDMSSVKKFCSRAMLINDGNMLEIGSPHAIAEQYSALNQLEIDQQIEADSKKEQIVQNNLEKKRKHTKYLKAKILDRNMKLSASFDTGEAMIAHVEWHGLSAEKIESIGINIFKLSGEHITGINTRTGDLSPGWKSRGEIDLEYNLNLQPGKYYLLVEAFEKEGKAVDSLLDGPKFNIRNKKMQWSGLTELPHVWRAKA